MIQFLHQVDRLMDPFQSATHKHTALYILLQSYLQYERRPRQSTVPHPSWWKEEQIHDTEL